jgi:transposase InsO family protein
VWQEQVKHLPAPKAPLFTTRICGFEFHILRFRFGQARRARNSQVAQALGIERRFYSLREDQITIEKWKNYYHTKRLLSSLGYPPPAPEAIVSMDQRPTYALTNFQFGPLKWG